MSDIKITQLTGLTTPADTDLLEIVDDVGGTPTSKKIQKSNLVSLTGMSVTATSAELNIMDGVTSSTVELNYLDGTVVTDKGVLFGDGTKIDMSVSTFFFDSATGMLEIKPNDTGVITALKLTNTAAAVNDGPAIEFISGASTTGIRISCLGKALNECDINIEHVATGASLFYGDVSTGNVGIGITTPLAPLTAFGSSGTGPGATDKGIFQVPSSSTAGLSIGAYNSGSFGMYIQGIDARAGQVTTYALILNPVGGDVGINDTSPSFKLDVNGTGQFTGKLTLGGGSDPPYVLYDLETRQSTIDRIKKEVPKGKLGGAAMFFNSDTNMMEVFVPSEGKFYDLMGTELDSRTPITTTYDVKDKYYFIPDTGEVKSFEVPTIKKQYKIKKDYSFDNTDGKFKDKDNKIVTKTIATEYFEGDEGIEKEEVTE